MKIDVKQLTRIDVKADEVLFIELHKKEQKNLNNIMKAFSDFGINNARIMFSIDGEVKSMKAVKGIK